MTKEELLKEIDFIQKWLYDLEICGEDLENSLRAIKNKVIEAFEKEDILFKIFCIVDPLSIMSTTELEHKAIMQIAEMLEPLFLPESEE